MTSKEVREIQFETVKRGYDPEKVDAVIEKAADQIDMLTAEKQQNEQKMMALAKKLEEYMAEEDKIRTTLLGAQKMSDTIMREARQKADIISKDAAIKAERLVSAAHQKVAREEESYIKIRAEVAKFKNDVLNIYKSHLEILSMIPEPEKEEQPVAEEKKEQAVAAETEIQTAPEEAQPEQTSVPHEEAVEQPDETAEPPIVEAAPETVSAETAPEEAKKQVGEEEFSPFSMSGGAKPEGHEHKNKFADLDFGDGFSFDEK